MSSVFKIFKEFQEMAIISMGLFEGRFIRNDVQNLLEPKGAPVLLCLIELITFSLDPLKTCVRDSSEFPQFESDIFEVYGLYLRKVHIFSTEFSLSVTADSQYTFFTTLNTCCNV